MARFERVIWIVLDSVGIGELPDAADYGDVGRTTLGHIAEYRALKIPTLVELGLANIAPLKNLGASGKSEGVVWKRSHAFAGKRYDHGPLGDGRGVAGPGVPGLSKRISCGDYSGV